MKKEPDPLTPQERKVIELVAQGHTDAQIAVALQLARATVAHYVRGICQKLKAPNRTAAAVRYYRCTGALSHPEKTDRNDGD
jgi:DNA-binding NarL/FixJ family response regulator